MFQVCGWIVHVQVQPLNEPLFSAVEHHFAEHDDEAGDGVHAEDQAAQPAIQAQVLAVAAVRPKRVALLRQENEQERPHLTQAGFRAVLGAADG